MSGYDPDGIAQTEADYFEIWPVCGEWFDVRDIAQMARRADAVSDDLKDLRPTKVAARILFALAITALVAISVYYGILWLAGRP
jgi:hypothetical protein